MQASVLEDYRLIARLGRGGMADVFLAVRRGRVGFARLIVIKRLREDVGKRPDAATFRTFMLDEANLAARLRHPHIAQTYEVGESDGLPYIAMEYLEGQSLSRVLRATLRAGIAMPPEIALRITGDVLAALDYAHQLPDYDGSPLGIIHRDVSPENMFWTYDGEIKLLDFGIAKHLHSSTETDIGLVKGKLTHMAPEQAQRVAVDQRADIFPVGIVLWECLAMRRMFDGNNPAATMKRLVYDPIPSIAEVAPGVEPAVAAICERALQRDVNRRYQTAAEMQADIERVLGGRSPRRGDLSKYIQRLFEGERQMIANRINSAMTGDAVVNLSIRDSVASPSGEIQAQSMQTERPVSSHHSSQQPFPVLQPSQTIETQAGTNRNLVLAGVTGLSVGVAAILGVLMWQRQQPAHGATVASALAPGVTPAAAEPPTTAPAPGPEFAIRMCGSTTVGLELAPALVTAFLQDKGAIDVTRVAGTDRDQKIVSAVLSGKPIRVEIRAKGSATAFEAMAAGTCDIGMASRQINDKEIVTLSRKGFGDMRLPAAEHVIALDGIAVIAHPNNPIRELDKKSLHDIFTGRTTDWSAVHGPIGPITLYTGTSTSGTRDTFKNLVLGSDDMMKHSHEYDQTDAIADGVASDPSAIGIVGLAYVRSAKALAIAETGATPQLPSIFTVMTEGYLLSRRLYLYTGPNESAMVMQLVSYATSARGQTTVAKTGFIDLGTVLFDNKCDSHCPARYAGLVAHAQRIALDFRFQTGSNDPDSRATHDLDRVVAFLRNYPNAKLMLLGFSDSMGGIAANMKLSLLRAQAIERELATRGVHAAVVEGFGPAMPVASNATEADRQRNRRVEVWLEH